jgi:hypothetical protein
MFVVRQRLGEHVPVTKNKQETIEVLLSDGNGFFCWVRPEAI